QRQGAGRFALDCRAKPAHPDPGGETTMHDRARRTVLAVAAAAALFGAAARADLKIAYIDPLSGGAASAGLSAQKHIAFFTDRINAQGGLNGEKITVLSDRKSTRLNSSHRTIS